MKAITETVVKVKGVEFTTDLERNMLIESLDWVLELNHPHAHNSKIKDCGFGERLAALRKALKS